MANSLEEALIRLRRGEAIAFSTETFFGLGADPRSVSGVHAVCELKSRKAGYGIPLIMDEASRLEPYLAEESEEARTMRLKLQKTFWPGPLTLVVAGNNRAKVEFVPEIFGADFSFAVRVSSDAQARHLAEHLGGLISATSANPHHAPPARSVEEVQAYFPELYVVPVKERESYPEASTIVDVRTFPFTVLREGAISKLEVQAALDE